MDPYPDPHGSVSGSASNNPHPDPHISDKLDPEPDPDPHQFADDTRENVWIMSLIEDFFKGLSLYLEDKIWTGTASG